MIGRAKFTRMEECTDFQLEEFNLIYFLWNGYKVATFKVNRKENTFYLIL